MKHRRRADPSRPIAYLLYTYIRYILHRATSTIASSIRTDIRCAPLHTIILFSLSCTAVVCAQRQELTLGHRVVAIPRLQDFHQVSSKKSSGEATTHSGRRIPCVHDTQYVAVHTRGEFGNDIERSDVVENLLRFARAEDDGARLRQVLSQTCKRQTKRRAHEVLRCQPGQSELCHRAVQLYEMGQQRQTSRMKDNSLSCAYSSNSLILSTRMSLSGRELKPKRIGYERLPLVMHAVDRIPSQQVRGWTSPYATVRSPKVVPVLIEPPT